MSSTGEVFTFDEGYDGNGGGPGLRVQRFSAGGVFASAFAVEGYHPATLGGLTVDARGSGAVYVVVTHEDSSLGVVGRKD